MMKAVEINQKWDEDVMPAFGIFTITNIIEKWIIHVSVLTNYNYANIWKLLGLSQKE